MNCYLRLLSFIFRSSSVLLLTSRKTIGGQRTPLQQRRANFTSTKLLFALTQAAEFQRGHVTR
jgi:hypothetical protein